MLRSIRPLLLATTLLACGCSRAEPSASTAPGPVDPAPAKAQAQTAPPEAPLVLARGLRFVKPGGGDVATLVREERERAEADGRQLIVYVGATWCEPCQRFHQAAQAGELDADFPDLNILEFDIDEDRERVLAAGYRSKLIPLFVKPGPDGRASDRRFEGGPKGERAVATITPRLRRLLAR